MSDKKTENNNEKILKMPYRNKITDAEINSLFLGLCRIVKQQALEDAQNFARGETIRNENLCKEIVKKNREIEMLRMINYQLKKKIDLLLSKNVISSNETANTNG